MNSDEIWLLQLWSGTFGSAISAVISAAVAAAVAVLVVNLSNRHQSKLAKDALAEQRALAAEAANKQRRFELRDRLEQQRAMALQLDEQRNEASKARTYAAIADLVTFVDMAFDKYRRGESLEDVYVRTKSAVVRIRLDLEHDALSEELQKWPGFLWRLTMDANSQLSRPVSDPGPERRLVIATTAITDTLPLWPRADEQSKMLLVAKLRETRELAAANAAEYRNALPKRKHGVAKSTEQ